MSARTFDWSVAAQVKRIVAVDARVTGIDALYSVLYVLAGFYISAPNDKTLIQVTASPIIILCGVLGYLAIRICSPERDGKTAMFYANLPRTRALTYWVHAASLAAFALVMEAVIGVAILLRLNAAEDNQLLTITPVLMVLPLFVLSAIVWICYGNFRAFITIPAVVSLMVFVSILINWDWDRYENLGRHLGSVPVQTAQAMIVRVSEKSAHTAMGLLFLTAVLVWHGSYRWTKTQPGDLK